jgi:exosortase H (IPTLxxWG-CTERM-specific)
MEPSPRIAILLSPPWLRFTLLCSLFMLLSIWLEPYLTPLCRMTADQVTTLLVLSGLAPHQQGELITLSGFTVRIVTECTPLYACLLYCSFVLAQPAQWMRTMIGLLTGVLLISTVNLLRIAAVTAAGPVVSTYVFDVLHVYLGQVVMLLLVVAAALVWLHWRTSGPSPLPFLLRAALLATLFFVPWVIVNRAYVALLDTMVAGLFGMLYAGNQLLIPRPLAIYNHTFAVPLFLALVLAGRGRWSVNRFAAIVAGVYGIAAWHALFRITHVLWTARGVTAIVPFHQGIYLLGQFVLPFLFWLWVEGGFTSHGRKTDP